MRKSMAAGAAIMLLAVPVWAARAQGTEGEAEKNRAGLRLGYYDFNDSMVHSIVDPGFAIELGYGRMVRDDMSLDLSLGYVQAAGQGVADFKGVTLATFFVEDRYYLTPDKTLSPFLGAGLGAVMTSTHNDLTHKDYNHWAYGYEAMLGLSWRVAGNIELELQTCYSTAHTVSGLSLGDIDVGAVTTSLGVYYRF